MPDPNEIVASTRDQEPVGFMGQGTWLEHCMPVQKSNVQVKSGPYPDMPRLQVSVITLWTATYRTKGRYVFSPMEIPRAVVSLYIG